jgi:hypothetical protein
MLSACPFIPHINFWIYEPIFMKLGIYIMAPEPNGVLHKSLPSFCASVRVSFIVAMQRLGKNVTAAMNTHATVE